MIMYDQHANDEPFCGFSFVAPLIDLNLSKFNFQFALPGSLAKSHTPPPKKKKK